MDWQPGQLVECEATQEVGMIESHEGASVCISLGSGIKIYGSHEALSLLGWKPIDSEKNSTNLRKERA